MAIRISRTVKGPRKIVASTTRAVGINGTIKRVNGRLVTSVDGDVPEENARILRSAGPPVRFSDYQASFLQFWTLC